MSNIIHYYHLKWAYKHRQNNKLEDINYKKVKLSCFPITWFYTQETQDR